MIDLFFDTERLHLISFNTHNAKLLLDKNLSQYYKWFGDHEITKYNSHGIFPKSQKEIDNYFNICENDKNLLVFMIIEKETKKHIGNISLQNINLINRTAEFAIIIGERIYAGTPLQNIGMIKAFKKINMKFEGELKEAFFLNGKFESIVNYAILKKDWDETNK